MATLYKMRTNAAFRKQFTDRMSAADRTQFEKDLGVTGTGTTQAKSGGTGSFGTGPLAAGPQKKRKASALGAPTNIGKKRLLGG